MRFLLPRNPPIPTLIFQTEGIVDFGIKQKTNICINAGDLTLNPPSLFGRNKKVSEGQEGKVKEKNENVGKVERCHKIFYRTKKKYYVCKNLQKLCGRFSHRRQIWIVEPVIQWPQHLNIKITVTVGRRQHSGTNRIVLPNVRVFIHYSGSNKLHWTDGTG